MKIITIIYNPVLDEHYAICQSGHNYFCSDSSRHKDLETLLEKLNDTVPKDKKIEIKIDKSIPEKTKEIIKEFIKKNFPKAQYSENLN